ncbi:tetratricopeptide repeat protein [Tengunoibacter tsumagoiensis]|uniref:HTH cro/C1-type domain-containing protein n=1 Tax=Tengunoibacter tsumagoiensis TaxID=2014871 RepID=A0A402A1B1_9CHLR|nr:tetratricopeptide repeat protein [Tengunoibacter tsumagoiensis]GCE12801.1 hypothetical protein KTT_26600 [Tengunoibacter tsumagoiensis]
MTTEKPSNEKLLKPNSKLKAMRLKQGWTHQVLASKIGLADSHTASRWERGIAQPSLHFQNKLIEVSGLSAEELGFLDAQISDNPLNSSTAPIQHEPDATTISMYKLPAFITSFVGRQEEMALLSEMLTRPEIRMITLLGPGGIGKTRLAIQIAPHVHNYFTDGICFVAFNTLNSDALVVSTLASELSIYEDDKNGTSLIDRIKYFLHTKRFLLILDTFEQVIQAAPLLEELLIACPQLKVLVTSREILRVQAEHIFTVPPLSLPEPTTSTTLEDNTNSTAVTLFIQRARAHDATFKLTKTNLVAIMKLCKLLDGLPLAIELAASRVKLLSPSALLARRSQLIHLLKNNVHTTDERHHTLYNTIRWSYDLLNEQERWFFRQMAIFAGETSLTTLENFFATSSQDAVAILERVYALLNKSLLQAITLSETETQVLMLDMVRTYALELLKAEGELHTIQHSHALYYLNVVEKAAYSFKGPEQYRGLQELEKEIKNIRAALDWLIAENETALALKFCEAYGKFCGLRGYWNEERELLKAALDLPQTPESRPMRARVLRRAGHLEYRLRSLETAELFHSESATLSRELGDTQNLAGALNGLASVYVRKGETEKAAQLLEEGIAAARESRDIWSIANALESRGRFLHHQGNLQAAQKMLAESLDLSRSIEDKETITRTLFTLSSLELAQNHVQRAAQAAREGFELAQELGTKPLLALALEILGTVTAFQGQYEQAREHFRASIMLAEQLGDTSAVRDRQIKMQQLPPETYD